MMSVVADARPLHVVVVGFNRPHSLQRLLHSLETAEYVADTPPITVMFALDQPNNRSVSDAIDAVIHGFGWPHGEVKARRRRSRAGLRDNVLGAWTPSADTDPPAIFLEDDIELSPLWWHWIQATLRRYATSPELPGLVGVSLFTPDNLNEPYRNRGDWATCPWQARHARSRQPDAASALLFGQPCSWGALYLAGPWRRFLREADALRRMDKANLPLLPCRPASVSSGPAAECKPADVVANRWGSSSWKRLLLVHMYAHGLYMVFPNLPSRTSFSTNHVEPGTHLAAKSAAELGPMLRGQRARHTVSLVTHKSCAGWRMACDLGDERPFELPSADELSLWDFYCDQQPAGNQGRDALSQAGEKLLAMMPKPSAQVPEVPALAYDEYVARVMPARPADEL